MKLKRDSRIVKWAYLADSYGPPNQTSLCAVFWRVVLLTPLQILAPLAVVLGVVGTLAVQAWRYPRNAAITLLIIAIGVVAGVTAGRVRLWYREHQEQEYEADYERRRRNEPPPPRVIRDGFRAVKGKVCPIVEIK